MILSVIICINFQVGDLPPNVQFQFIEGERMKADEYDLLISNPAEFLLERVLPRVFNELKEPGSMVPMLLFEGWNGTNVFGRGDETTGAPSAE